MAQSNLGYWAEDGRRLARAGYWTPEYRAAMPEKDAEARYNLAIATGERERADAGVLEPFVNLGYGAAQGWYGGLRALGNTFDQAGLGNGLKDYADETLRQNQHWNVRSGANWLDKSMHTTGQAAASTAPGIALGFIPKVGTAASFAYFASLHLGDAVERNKKYGLSDEAAWAEAVPEALAVAGLENLGGTVAWGKRIAKTPGLKKAFANAATYAERRAIAKQILALSRRELGTKVADSMWKRLGVDILQNAGEEGAEEGFQYAVEALGGTLAQMAGKGDSFSKAWGDNFSMAEMWENVKGGLIGGAGLAPGMAGLDFAVNKVGRATQKYKLKSDIRNHIGLDNKFANQAAEDILNGVDQKEALGKAIIANIAERQKERMEDAAPGAESTNNAADPETRSATDASALRNVWINHYADASEDSIRAEAYDLRISDAEKLPASELVKALVDHHVNADLRRIAEQYYSSGNPETGEAAPAPAAPATPQGAVNAAPTTPAAPPTVAAQVAPEAAESAPISDAAELPGGNGDFDQEALSNPATPGNAAGTAVNPSSSESGRFALTPEEKQDAAAVNFYNTQYGIDAAPVKLGDFAAAGYDNAGLPPTLGYAQNVADSLGAGRIVPVLTFADDETGRSTGADFSGMSSGDPRTMGRMLVNMEHNASPEQMLHSGLHEIVHNLIRNNEDAYKILVERILPLVYDQKAFDERLKRYADNRQHTQAPANRDAELKEFICDLTADAMKTERFWKAAEKHNPSLARKLLDALVELLDKVRSILGYRHDHNLEVFGNNIEKVIDLAAQFVADPRSMRTTTETDVAQSEAEGKSTAQRAAEKINAYINRFGTIINSDNAKLLFKGEGYDPHSPESVKKFHPQAGELVKALFNHLLKNRKGKGNGTVVFTGGGNGSGKSSVLSGAEARNADFVFDSAMVNKEAARESIQRVLDNGQKPLLYFVFRDPAEAWFEGVKSRNESADGHIVPEAVFANTHSKAKQNFIELVREFGDKVEYIIRDNSDGGREITLEELESKPNYTKEQILEVINARDIEKAISIRDSAFGRGRTDSRTTDSGRSAEKTESGHSEARRPDAAATGTAGQVPGEVNSATAEKSSEDQTASARKTEASDKAETANNADTDELPLFDQAAENKSATGIRERVIDIYRKLVELDRQAKEHPEQHDALRSEGLKLLEGLSLDDIRRGAAEHQKRYQGISDAFEAAAKAEEADSTPATKQASREAGDALNGREEEDSIFNRLLRMKGDKGSLVAGRYVPFTENTKPEAETNGQKREETEKSGGLTGEVSAPESSRMAYGTEETRQKGENAPINGVRILYIDGHDVGTLTTDRSALKAKNRWNIHVKPEMADAMIDKGFAVDDVDHGYRVVCTSEKAALEMYDRLNALNAIDNTAETTEKDVERYRAFLKKKIADGTLSVSENEQNVLADFYKNFPLGKSVVNKIGEKIELSPQPGGSIDEYIHHFAVKRGNGRENFSQRHLDTFEEIFQTTENFDDRILQMADAKDENGNVIGKAPRILFVRSANFSKTGNHLVVVAVSENGLLVDWTHEEARNNQIKKYLEREREFVEQYHLKDAQGNPLNIGYDEYLKEKLIKPMYLASALATSDSSRQIANPNRTDNIAPTKEKSNPKNAAETKKTDKIEDYGEKIGGARKDKARADMEAALAENPTDAEILSLPSAKLYPAPNYAKLAEQGMNAESLALLRVVYDFLRPKKPGPSAIRWTSKKDVFINSVRETRQLISDIIAGKLTLKDLGKEVTERDNRALELGKKIFELKTQQRKIADSIKIGISDDEEAQARSEYRRLDSELRKLYEGFSSYGHRWGDQTAAKRNELYHTAKAVMETGLNPAEMKLPYIIHSIVDSEGNFGYGIAGNYDYTENFGEIAEKFAQRTRQMNASAAEAKAAGKKPFQLDRKKLRIYATSFARDSFYITYEGETVKGGFKTVEAVREYANSDAGIAEMTRILEERKQSETEAKQEYRHETSPRTGKDYRNGRDITPAELAATFGFRGVEFGNWADQKQRQNRLNETYDALLDLAELLGISPKAISLGGRLGIAFGSRGFGNFAAHFEPGNFAINLTKTRGAGSLAHEWLHALDNYFAKQSGHKLALATNLSLSALKAGGMRSELADKFYLLVKALQNSDMMRRSRKYGDYWRRIHEVAARAFSRYIVDRAAERGLNNDFLSSVMTEKDMSEAAQKLTPNATAEDMKTIGPAFDAFFNEVQEKTDEAGNTLLYSMAEDAENTAAGNRPYYQKDFAQSVDEVVSGKYTGDGLVFVSSTPDALTMVGIPGLPVMMTQQHIRDIYRNTAPDGRNAHGLGNQLKALPQMLEKPVAIIASEQKGRVVVLTQYRNALGQQIIVPVIIGTNTSADGGLRITANIAASVYSKSSVQKMLEEAIEAEKAGQIAVFGANKKIASKLPMAGTPIVPTGGFNATSKLPYEGLQLSSGGGFNVVHNIDDPGSPVKGLFKKQTDSLQFKRWFRDSKAVDENGEPLVFSHFTGDLNDFYSFEAGHDNGVFRARKGFYFAETEEANEIDLREYFGNREIKAWLSIKNPLDLRRDESWDAVKKITDVPGNVKNLSDFINGGFAQTDDFIDAVVKHGYDGLILPDMMAGGAAFTSWIVFSPNQIKSATENIGTFDKQNDDIRYSMPGDEEAENGAVRSGTEKYTDRDERFILNSEDPELSNMIPIRRAKNQEEAINALKTLPKEGVKNRETGIVAQINRTQRDKLVSGAALSKSQANGFAFVDHFLAVANIDRMFANASMVDDRKDNGGDKNVLSIKRFVAPCLINGNFAEAYITVKETVGSKLYSLELDEIKRPSDLKGSTLKERYYIPEGYHNLLQKIEKARAFLKKADISDTSDVTNALEKISHSIRQKFKSGNTSLHQVAAGFRKIDFAPGTVNLDLGGGKFDAGTRFLAEKGVTNLVFDPVNRDAAHNRRIFEAVKNGGVDTVTCNNVLNVIQEADARSNVILQAAKALKPGGTAYFTVYEGDGSGQGRQSQADAWQENRRTADYLEEVKQHFADVTLKNKVITARKPITEGKLSAWATDETFENPLTYSMPGDEDFGKDGVDYRRKIDPMFDFIMEYSDSGIVNPGLKHAGEDFHGSTFIPEAYRKPKPVKGALERQTVFLARMEKWQNTLANAPGTPLSELAAAYVRKFGGDEAAVAEEMLEKLRHLNRNTLRGERAADRREFTAEHEREENARAAEEYKAELEKLTLGTDTPEERKAKADLDRMEQKDMADIAKQSPGLLRSIWNAFRKKDLNGKPDMNFLTMLIRDPMHIGERFPMIAKLRMAAIDAGDMKNRVLSFMTGEDFDKIKRLERQDKAAYKKVSDYLVQSDVDQTGAGNVKEEDGKFTAAAADGTILGQFDDEESAWTALFENERNLLTVRHGFSEDAADAVKAFRQTMRRQYLILRDGSLHQLRQLGVINADTEKYEIELPGEKEGETEKVDLFELYRDMGQRSGYYFPRIRHGRFLMFAQKSGANPVMIGFDTKANRALAAAKYSRMGYQVTYAVSNAPDPHFAKQVNPAALIDLFSNLSNRLKDQLDGNIKFADTTYTRKDGTKEPHFTVSGDIDRRLGNLLKGAGGRFYGDAWHFANADEKTRNQIRAMVAGYQKHHTAALTVQGVIGQTIVDMMRENTSRAHRIGRRDATGMDVVKGYEEDALTAMAHSLSGIAGGTARSAMANNMYRIIAGMDENIEDYIQKHLPELDRNAPDYRKKLEAARLAAVNEYYREAAEKAVDSARQPQLARYVDNYVKNMLRNTSGLERVVGFWKSLAAIKYLFRLSGAFNNLGGAITTVPAVLDHHTKCGIAFALGRMGEGYKLYGQFLYYNRFGKGRQLTGEAGAVMEIIHRNGWDGAELCKAATQAGLTFAAKGYRKFTDLALYAFGTMEQYNRAASIWSAYQALLRQKGIDASRLAPLEREKLVKEARNLSDFANGDYTKANKLFLAQGDSIGHLLFDMTAMFKTYNINLYNNIMDMILHGNWRRGGLKGTLYISTMLMLVAGIPASLVYTVLTNALGAAALPPPDDGEKREDQLFNWLADNGWDTTASFLRYGVNGLLGANTLSTYKSFAVATKEAFENPKSALELGGAPASVVEDVWEAVKEYRHGRFLSGTEKLMPAAIGAPARAIREKTAGVTDRHGRIRKDVDDRAIEMDWNAFALRSLGFNPVSISEKTDRLRSEKIIEKTYAEKRKEIYDRYRYWYNSPGHDAVELADITKDIEAYNARVERSKRKFPKIDAKSLKRAIK